MKSTNTPKSTLSKTSSQVQVTQKVRTDSMGKSDGRSAETSSKRFSSFRTDKKGLKTTTEGLQHMVFNYASSNNSKNVFVENVKNMLRVGRIATAATISHIINH